MFVVTHADPVPGGGTMTEARLVQPLLMARARTPNGRAALRATLDLEGLTMPRGELDPGAWGEGFNDRRHPHTYAHEMMLELVDPLGTLGGVHVSLSAGKGFAPFGTPDPMHRPPLRYPVNHHWSQVLERAVVVLGARAGSATAEAGLMNGDEPERPGQWPRIRGRFGDSWSARIQGTPLLGVTVQVSHARVKSPEHRPGAGSDQVKWNASMEVERPLGTGRLDALLEWARTSESGGFFVFHSALAETDWGTGRHRPYLRLERTERPEEQRTLNPFRSIRPHLDNSILGISRFTLLTAGYARRVGRAGGVHLEPFAEVTWGTVRRASAGVFDPKAQYGRNDLWSASVGLRMRTDGPLHLMGRYGVLALEPPAPMRGHP